MQFQNVVLLRTGSKSVKMFKLIIFFCSGFLSNFICDNDQLKQDHNLPADYNYINDKCGTDITALTFHLIMTISIFRGKSFCLWSQLSALKAQGLKMWAADW